MALPTTEESPSLALAKFLIFNGAENGNGDSCRVDKFVTCDTFFNLLGALKRDGDN